VRDDTPLGDVPEFVRAKSLHEAFQQAAKRVREWCLPAAGGRGPCSRRLAAAVAQGFPDRPDHQDFESWRRGKGMLLASWNRFKGLEADAIVIIETAGDNDARERANRYVARSRAKHLLTVVQAA
jgi:hypothetical protein